MSRTVKFLISFFFVFMILLAGSVWYYRLTHPRYIPPPPREEITITTIPGWNLRQVAEYLVLKKLASSTEDVFRITGQAAQDYRLSRDNVPSISTGLKVLEDKPAYVSYEGYLAPETYRVFADARLIDILKKLLNQRGKQVTEEMRQEMRKQKKSFHEVLTMASMLEKEVKTDEDRKKVADILWRRNARRWALQVDSSVHYAVDRTGNVFTTDFERSYDSYWNTYKYPGLPLGPISNPSLRSIEAALFPESNSYWYFLTTPDGEVKYGRTLEEHVTNRNRYLR